MVFIELSLREHAAEIAVPVTDAGEATTAGVTRPGEFLLEDRSPCIQNKRGSEIEVDVNRQRGRQAAFAILDLGLDNDGGTPLTPGLDLAAGLVDQREVQSAASAAEAKARHHVVGYDSLKVVSVGHLEVTQDFVQAVVLLLDQGDTKCRLREDPAPSFEVNGLVILSLGGGATLDDVWRRTVARASRQRSRGGFSRSHAVLPAGKTISESK